MRRAIVLLSLMLGAISPAIAEVSIGLSIGINVPVFPQFQPVPGYPVYYAPEMDANYFFYDGMFWVYQGDNWYASSWYNGPWALVEPMVVPVFILRVPVRYYREPPVYFRGAPVEAPPPWGAHYGNDWQRQRVGWDHWNRGSAPPPAPLPTYQKQYSGQHYPPPEQQRTITKQNYSYQPHDPVVRQHFERIESQKGSAVAQKQDRPPRAASPAEPQPPPAPHESQHPPQPPPVARTEPSHQPQETRREPPQQQESPPQPPRPEPQPPKAEPRQKPQQQAAEPDRAPPVEKNQEQRKDESVDKARDKEGQQDNR